MKIKLNIDSVEPTFVSKTKTITHITNTESLEKGSQHALSIESLRSHHRGFGRVTNILLILCVLSGIFFFSSSVTLFAQSRVAIKDDMTQACTKKVAQASGVGLMYDENICNFESYDYLWDNNFEQSTIDTISRDIEAQTKLLEISIASSQSTLKDISAKLVKLEVEGFAEVNRYDNESLYQYNSRLKELINKQTDTLSSSLILIDQLSQDISLALDEYKTETTSLKSNYIEQLQTYIEHANNKNTDILIDTYIDTKLALEKFNEEMLKAKISQNSKTSRNFVVPAPVDLTLFRVFTPQEFVALGDSITYSNVAKSDAIIPITGNAAADDYIRAIAEKRGYKRRPEALGNLTNVDGYQLQPEAARAWSELKNASAKEGFPIGLVSGYRSITGQQEIFMSRLTSTIGGEFSYDKIITGAYDTQIQSVLNYSSIPGYSKHHTGFTVDVNDVTTGAFTTFASSKGYAWLSANNYYNAKRFGFIPSYPANGGQFGPVPEAWEYIYVGVDLLK